MWMRMVIARYVDERCRRCEMAIGIYRGEIWAMITDVTASLFDVEKTLSCFHLDRRVAIGGGMYVCNVQ